MSTPVNNESSEECCDTPREGLEDIIQLNMEVITHQEKGSIDCEDDGNLGRKRDREDDSSGSWTVVNGRGKKVAKRQTSIDEVRCSNEDEKVEICIYNNEKFPKQFALARLFKTNGIMGILHVKYMNPYKLMVTFDNESNAEKMMNCKTFIDMGWRSQKSWEVAVSYGIIRDIELDLSIEDFLNNVSCDVKILSARRLNRRCNANECSDKDSNANGWTASESLRICFKGAHVPSHVNIFGMRAKVERYILPVTQCSKCWRFGHIAKMCKSTKVICPKCGGKHENCDTTSFVCVNCKANHLALDKQCPIYLKEKRLRELMNDFNCTYRKALLLYVPPSPTPSSQVNNITLTEKHNDNISQESIRPVQVCNEKITYADITKSAVSLSTQKQSPTLHSNPQPKQKLAQHKKRKQSRPSATAAAGDMDCDSEASCTTSFTSEEQGISSLPDKPNKSSAHRRTPSDPDTTVTSFSYLIGKIVNALMNKGSLMNKVNNVVKIIVEWLIQIIVKNLPENSIVSKLINGLSQ
ncbi:hypothetical protein HW555_004539 [Spodoptera exigua]|uniref:Gag-like protein n=1 Tax=Spodoptera exigua TaxID=7107 RepID=A0A835GKW9_SPOEX|nr:hypothetical protein HW555_004539 [Spodoptera exigua]